MPLRFFLRYLVNNEQLIQRMADSYPIRKAARLAVSAMYRAKSAAYGDHMPPDRFKRFLKAFKTHFQQEIEDDLRRMKKY